MTDIRCSDAMDLDFGNVVNDKKGKRWVFIGWCTNTVGKVPIFVECVDGMAFFQLANMHVYTCAFMEALERKFPGITGMYGK